MFEKTLEKKNRQLKKVNARFEEIRQQICDLQEVRDSIEPWYAAMHMKDLKLIDKKLNDLRKQLAKTAKSGCNLEDSIRETEKVRKALNAYMEVMNG